MIGFRPFRWSATKAGWIEPGSVGYRRVALALVLVVLAVAAMTAYLVASAQSVRRQTIVQRFDGRRTNAARFMEAYVAQVLTQEKALAERAFAGPVTASRFEEIISYNQFGAAVLIDGSGKLLAVTPANPKIVGTDVGARYAHLRSAMAGTPAVSDVVPSASRQEPIVGFAAPFDSSSGGRRVFSGAYTITSTPLQPFVTSALSTFQSAHVYLIDSAGLVISADRLEHVGLQLGAADAPLVARVAQSRSGFLDQGHTREYYVAGPVGGTPWQLVFTVDSAELFQTITPFEHWSPWVALVGMLVMGLGMVALFVRALERRAWAEDERGGQQVILDTASDAYVGMDARGLVTDWNTAAARLLGWGREEALGQPVAGLMIPARDRQAYSNGLSQFMTTGVERHPRHPITLTAQHRDGHEIPVELTISRSHWRNTWRFHGFLRDITERLVQEKKLQELALTDSLTGLANRRAFLERLEQACAQARRHGTRLDVLYADVDHFKRINDSYGHTAGDAILAEIADRLRVQFRTEDTIGRLGGDEFAIACAGLNASPEELAERLHAALAAPYSFRGEPILTTVSIGFATANNHESAEHLLERADTTMYRAKAAQRG